VDNEQHNTLCALSRTKGNAFYCAPRFHLSRELETHFRNSVIAAHSILLNPLDVGEILDNYRHNITYNRIGANPMLHSEFRRFKKSYSGTGEGAPELHESKLDLEYILQLSDELLGRTMESRFAKSVTGVLERLRPIERVQFLLGRVYQVTWLLLP
jgi:hypothetical protein